MTIQVIVIPSSNRTYRAVLKPRYDNHNNCHTEVLTTYMTNFFVVIPLPCIYTHTLPHIYSTPLFLSFGFSSFLNKNLLVTLFKHHFACWLLFNHEIRPLLCRNFKKCSTLELFRSWFLLGFGLWNLPCSSLLFLCLILKPLPVLGF